MPTTTTVRDAANDLLGYLNPRQRTYPPTSTEDDPIPQVLSALYGAMCELAVLGVAWNFYAPRTIVLRAPTTLAVTGSWAADATTVEIADIQSYHLGCTIRFGSEPFNEITGISGTTVTLANPFLSAGSGSGIVYADCVTPATDVLDIVKPVSIIDGPMLEPANHPGAFNAVAMPHDYGRGRYQGDYRGRLDTHSQFYAVSLSGEPFIEDNPRLYWLDEVFKATVPATAAAKRLRLAPLPGIKQILKYRALLAPLKWVRADIYTTGTPLVDPGIIIPLEDTRVSTTFLPFARFRFAAEPVMADSKARAQIIENYKSALKAEQKLATVGRGFNPTPNPRW
jgi:hypothetical protein